MLYIAALPFTFHEVYVWSAAWSTAGIVALLRACARPTLGRIIATGAFGTLTVLSDARRVALGLTVVAVAARMWLGRTDPGRRAKQTAGGGRCSAAHRRRSSELGQVSPPLSIPDRRPGLVDDQPLYRQAALAANDGRLDGIQFIDTTVLAYFRPDGIRFVPYLP